MSAGSGEASLHAAAICATTINRTALAGPSIAIALITVQVIPAPSTPPSSRYFGSLLNTANRFDRSAASQTARHDSSAVACTNTFADQMLDAFVTCVLKMPCTLIRTPDKTAIKNPTILQASFFRPP